LFSITAFALAAITLPLVLELALVTAGSLRWVTRRTRSAVPSNTPCKGPLYIVVPAHNEELLIRRTVESLASSADSDTRILVIAHNCSDQTSAIARAAGAEVIDLNESSGKGKGRALVEGFSHAMANGAVAVGVLDADSIADMNFVPTLRRALGASEALQCRYELSSSEFQESAVSGLQALAFRAMNVIRARGRSGFGLSCGIFGNGFAIRTEVLRQVPYGAFSIAEDLEYHVALVSAGKKVSYTEQTTVHGLGADGNAAIAQRSRWEGGRLRIAREKVSGLTVSVLRGRIRLAEPLLDLLCLPIALNVALLGILLALSFLANVPLLKTYALAACTLVAFHVFSAAFAAPKPLKSLNLLLRVPFYIVWKLALVPRVLVKSRTNAAWERSSRTVTQVPKQRIS
jgi:cellulose synthase/poly-beta-1,6-N-acetylglucosamine synthase-like glycosyltransferase